MQRMDSTPRITRVAVLCKLKNQTTREVNMRSGMKRTVTTILLTAALLPGLALAAGNVAKGKALFEQNCASCHGPGGKGDGPAAVALTPKPRSLTDKAYMSALSDQHIFDTIKKGGAAVGKSPLMPSLGAALKDSEIHDVVAFVRSLAK